MASKWQTVEGVLFESMVGVWSRTSGIPTVYIFAIHATKNLCGFVVVKGVKDRKTKHRGHLELARNHRPWPY